MGQRFGSLNRPVPYFDRWARFHRAELPANLI
jgi:hypothetical protein